MNYEAKIAERDQKILSYESQILALQKQNVELSHQLAKLQRLIFGRSSERFVSAPYSGPNLFSGTSDDIQAASTPTVVESMHIAAHDRKKSKQSPRQLLDNLPSEIITDITTILPEDKPEGAELIGTEVQRKLAYTPGKFYVKQVNREKYVDRSSGKIYIAPKPAEALEKCQADNSLIADVVVSKFVDHIPEYRKQQQYKREGIVIPSSTMNDWTHKTAAYLKPIADAIKQAIINTNYVQVDESTIKVMQKDKTKIGYMWVINSPQLKMSYFDFYPSRGAKVPKLMLDNYNGNLQSDGYNAYEVLEKVNPDTTYFNCWAHARRKFEEAKTYNQQISNYVLQQIQLLYAVEQRCRDEHLNHDQRKTLRQNECRQKLEQLKIYLDEQSPKQIDGTPIHKAIGYTLNRWDKLTNYIDHGQIEIDNNLVENAIRPLALGRKNYLFAGSKDAASNIAVFYTIFSSCKALEINPSAYLIWVLDELPKYTIKNIVNFTPEAYAKL